MVYSSSFIFAHERTGDGYYFIKRQVLYAVLGLALLGGLTRISYEKIERRSRIFLLGTLLLIACVFIPGVGVKVGGAQRWIRLGLFQVQPAELVKLTFIAWLAARLAQSQRKVQPHNIWELILFPAATVGLLLLQPDFGTTVLLGMMSLGLLYLSGISLKRFAAMVGCFVLAGAGLLVAAPYRLERWMSYLNPWKDPTGKGFQILQSFLGFHNGRFMGVGLGNSREKLFFLPEAHNDFIFSVIGEELGYLGVLCVLGAYAFIIYRGFKASWVLYQQKRDPFGYFLGCGLSLYLGLQAFINLSVSLGLLPTKGMTLPLISYGGSSLLINLIAAGLLLNLSREARSEGRRVV